jgi:hypothetical protein
VAGPCPRADPNLAVRYQSFYSNLPSQSQRATLQTVRTTQVITDFIPFSFSNFGDVLLDRRDSSLSMQSFPHGRVARFSRVSLSEPRALAMGQVHGIQLARQLVITPKSKLLT